MKKLFVIAAALLGFSGSAFAQIVRTVPYDRTGSESVLTVTLTSANTEYSRTLPATCIGYDVQCRTGYDVKMGFASGTSGASYWTIKSGYGRSSFQFPYVNYASKVLYFQSAQAGVVVEIIVTLKPL